MNLTTLAWDICEILGVQADLEKRRELEERLNEFARLIEQDIRAEYETD